MTDRKTTKHPAAGQEHEPAGPPAGRADERISNGLLLGSGLLTLVTGVIGHRTNPPPGTECVEHIDSFLCWADALYEAAKLLALGGGGDSVNPWNVAARALGALFALNVVSRLVTPELIRRLERFRMRWLKNHTVVIGLGNKGLAWLRTHDGRKVVAIEKDATAVSSLGAQRPSWVLCDNAIDPKVLHAARVGHAHSVVVATGEDMRNFEIALLVCEIARAQRDYPSVDEEAPTGPRSAGSAEKPEQSLLRPEIFPHIANHGLRWELFNRSQLAKQAPFIRPFNLPERAAKTLLERFPVALQARDEGAARFHLVFIGFDDYAEALLLAACRLGPLIGQDRPRITIFCSDTKQVEERLAHRYPALSEFVQALTVRRYQAPAGLSAADMAQVEPSDTQPGVAREVVTGIFVQGQPDAEAVATALRVRRTGVHNVRFRAPLFVRVDRELPFKDLWVPWGQTPFAEEVFDHYGAIGPTIESAIDNRWQETLARKVHVHFVEDHAASNGEHYEKASSPAREEMAWLSLEEEIRESNRRAVDHYPLKLASVGRVVLGPPGCLPTESPKLDPDEAESLGELEHETWMREKKLFGWRDAKRRDDKRRRHPSIRPLDKEDPEKRKDTSQLIGIQAALSELKQENEKGENEEHPKETSKLGRVLRERVIVLVGHNILSAEEENRISTELPPLLRDLLTTQSSEEFWTFLTPLAPGADLVMARAALNWSEEQMKDLSASKWQPQGYRLLVAQASPVQVLIEKREDQRKADGRPPDSVFPKLAEYVPAGRNDTDYLDELLRGLPDFLSKPHEPSVPEEPPRWERRFIDLSPPGSDLDHAADPDNFQQALEINMRYLLERGDELIAALRPAQYDFDSFDAGKWRNPEAKQFGPGGTGDLVRRWLVTPNKSPPRVLEL